MKTLKSTLALKRLKFITVAKGSGIDANRKIAFITELAGLGFKIVNPELLDSISISLFDDYKKMIDSLHEIRGGAIDYVPLFTGFPTEVPDDETYFKKRILGFVHNICDWFEGDFVELENGIKVPEYLFDIYRFGADPITQFQSKDLFEVGAASQNKRKADSHIEWIELELIEENECDIVLEQFMLDLLYAKSSIKDGFKEDLKMLLNCFGPAKIEADEITMKENLAFVLKYFWETENYKAVKTIANTPTDILRLFAALTDSDVSLIEKIRFPKLKRKQRKVILSILENCKELADDLKRYKGLWLELGRYIHPSEYATVFPKTANAFDQLRNGKIVTYNSLTEQFIEQHNFEDLLAHLEKRPGVFLRKFHEILRRFPEKSTSVLDLLEQKAIKVPLKNLLILQNFFYNINELKNRTIVNKRGKVLVLANNSLGQLDDSVLQKIVEILTNGILDQMNAKESWTGKKVYIDPELTNFTVPLQQRSASDGLINVGRGSQIKIDFEKVLRLFVYWKDGTRETDYDLSVIQFDSEFENLGHVSYTNLKSDGILHSGDIQSAPHGATEFIDITLDKLDSKVKYLVVQIHKYEGDHFADTESFAGWMMRKEVENDVKSFDPKTVQNIFDLNGRNGYAVPIIVDLDESKIIISDLYMSGKSFQNNVENSSSNVAIVSKELMNFIHTRPNMFALSLLNLEGRNAVLVDEMEEADIKIGLTGCDINVGDSEKILAELI